MRRDAGSSYQVSEVGHQRRGAEPTEFFRLGELVAQGDFQVSAKCATLPEQTPKVWCYHGAAPWSALMNRMANCCSAGFK
jgi:hypothetical protein